MTPYNFFKGYITLNFQGHISHWFLGFLFVCLCVIFFFLCSEFTFQQLPEAFAFVLSSVST